MLTFLTGHEAYCLFLTLKTYFAGKRDYIKYKEMAIPYETYLKRNDRFQFEKLARKYKKKEALESFLISVFRENPNVWVGKLFDKEYIDKHTKRIGTLESLEYRFRQDICVICERLEAKNLKFKALFEIQDNTCLLWTWRMQNLIRYDTFCILCRLFNLFERFEQQMQDNITWKEYHAQYLAYIQMTPQIRDHDKHWADEMLKCLAENGVTK